MQENDTQFYGAGSLKYQWLRFYLTISMILENHVTSLTQTFPTHRMGRTPV